MTIGDPDETRRVRQNAAKRVGQAPGAKGGDHTKRLVLWVEVDEAMSVEDVERRVARG